MKAINLSLFSPPPPFIWQFSPYPFIHLLKLIENAPQENGHSTMTACNFLLLPPGDSYLLYWMESTISATGHEKHNKSQFMLLWWYPHGWSHNYIVVVYNSYNLTLPAVQVFSFTFPLATKLKMGPPRNEDKRGLLNKRSTPLTLPPSLPSIINSHLCIVKVRTN